ncbi:putative methyltransferase-domain-containing protein [Catenaria anguillulae PL171]|uniref:Putative methyltransferase-domain-containing protein n=1 Tax=Catenaria anguillulae PL171 TaxID=765915 RepID=A0A1Y2HZZ1_9FUNG|nr:putative methyltransferase-domain-containing protein [Catenaria anguillulae PL171]
MYRSCVSLWERIEQLTWDVASRDIMMTQFFSEAMAIQSREGIQRPIHGIMTGTSSKRKEPNARRAKKAAKKVAAKSSSESSPNLSHPPVYLSYTLRGYEDGQRFERTLTSLDRWAAQAADTLSVNLSTRPLPLLKSANDYDDELDTSCDSPLANHSAEPALLPDLSVTLRQKSSVFIGGQIWDTSFVLSCWFYARQALGKVDVGGLKICEVGAGIGLLSLTLGALDAHVTTTDLAEVVPILQGNLDLNPAISRSVVAHAVDWGDANAPPPPGYPFDLIVACDCIYSEVSSSDLALCLARLCSPKTVVYVVSEVRNESIQAAFAASIEPLFDVAFKNVQEEMWPFIPPELRSHQMRFYVLTPKKQSGEKHLV